MMKSLLLPIVFLLLLAGCASKEILPVAVKPADKKIDYLADVKPILDKRCVVCHSCYNSPCQLKMSSFEGIDRGGNKAAIYNAERLSAADPTRLFIDAQTTQQWQNEHGFFSVTSSNTENSNFNNSLLISLLDAKRQNPKSIGDYYPEADDLTCAKNTGELEDYLDDHPNNGMPFGFPQLSEKEFTVISQWLQQGALGPDGKQQLKITSPSTVTAKKIDKWESFLNNRDAKHQMTARYLYEHFFLAHITFDESGDEFYELIRSSTPPGEPASIIPTLRPYDNPGAERFYYRFRKIHSTIVHKTHMVVLFDNDTMRRFNELFIDTQWSEKPHVMDYDTVNSANPFVVFAQIPISSRYQFLLDNSEYIIRTFIRGPVCKGQIALNVIHDHFWVMFMDPEYDLSVRYPNFVTQHSNELRMPIENGSSDSVFKLFSDKYINDAIKYNEERAKFYSIIYKDGLGYDAIWRGNTAKDAPLLTIYRHFDSASVHKGALGDLPRTVWVIDYPLFERIYYALVAGFDVYGNVGHQTNIRRYMDRLRVEGESYFLDFLPKDQRQEIFNSWYVNQHFLAGEASKYIPSSMPGKIDFSTNDAKREMVEYIIEHHLNSLTDIKLDKVNYFRAGEEHPPLPEQYKTEDDLIQAIRAVSRPGTAFVKAINGYNSNLAYIRIRIPQKKDVFLSVVVNRWHDNVSFMFDEKKRLNPTKDEADFIFGSIGSYPNFFFDVHQKDLADFFDLLTNYQDNPEYIAKILKYGVGRDEDGFWDHYDWFQKRFYEDDPLQAGLYDLNRYYYHAWGGQSQ
jgi:hypothetical protein